MMLFFEKNNTTIQCYFLFVKMYVPKRSKRNIVWQQGLWGNIGRFFRQIFRENTPIILMLCQMTGNNDEIWYATNIELYEYITAQKQLVISADNKLVYNPTNVEIWFTDDDDEHSILPGQIMKLA